MSLLNDFLRPGMWVIAATVLVNVCNFFYHLFLIRFLSPADYGILNALMALLLIITVPAGTVQTTISQRVSQRLAAADWDGIFRLIRGGFVRTGLLGLLLCAVIVLFRHSMAAFLQVPSSHLLVIWAGSVVLMLMVPVALGAFQGLQQFPQLAINLSFGGAAKLGCAVVLVLSGAGVGGALHGFWLASALALLLAAFQIRIDFKRRLPQNKLESSGIFVSLSGWVDEIVAVVRKPFSVSHYTLWAAAGVLAYTSLTNMDVVLVKHYFPPEASGAYAIASILSRMVLFLPAALSMILFPKVAYLSARNEDPRPMLIKVILLAGVLSAAAAGLFFCEPEWILKLFTGTVHAQAVGVVKILSWAMCGMSIANVGLVYLLGAKNLRRTIPYHGAALAQIGLISLFHGSLPQAAGMILIVACALGGYSLWVAYGG